MEAHFSEPPLNEDLKAALTSVSTATITSQLLKRGYRRTFLRGLFPHRPDLHMVGRAFTLRYVPSREDLSFNVDYDNSSDVQRMAVERISRDEVLVIDARGSVDAASFGHIIATRIMMRGASGLVTDGALRDSPRFGQLDLATYSLGPHATTSSVAHFAADMNVPIACARVLVCPGDIMVGDAEGVVAIPAAVAEDVARSAVAQEIVEEYALECVRGGEPISNVYPLQPERRPDFEAWLSSRTKGT
jgi:regulator of RNase E activity RraA